MQSRRVPPCPPLSHNTQGFTLVELLVALFIMSLLALMSWRGIDSMARAQEGSRERADHVAALQTALAQWQTDLDQAFQTRQVSAIDFDCRMLRVTRRYSDTELRVIGWVKRGVGEESRWLRWQSAALNNNTELQNAWQEAGRWGENPTSSERKSETEIAAIDDWQIFFYRTNAWSNPCSAAGAPAQAPAAPPPALPPGQGTSSPAAGAAAAAAAALPPSPEGVRLILKLSQGQALAGTITRDWVKPNLK
jgi:general secretion pathway protein J